MTPAPMGLCPSDYDRIEAAVLETERGRWFLTEHARRCRAEDTARILAAVDRLEFRVAHADAAETQARAQADRLAALLDELAQSIASLAEIGPSAPAAEPPRVAKAAHLAAPETSLVDNAGELEARIAALAHLGQLGRESRFRRFG